MGGGWYNRRPIVPRRSTKNVPTGPGTFFDGEFDTSTPISLDGASYDVLALANAEFC